MTSGYLEGSSRRPTPAWQCPFLDIDTIIGDRETKIIICCGSGGVGKTTTSAALALRAAEAGPQGRGAHHRPGPSAGPVARASASWTTPHGRCRGIDTAAGGSLDAMMLDMKRTFDEVVIAHSTPEKAAGDPGRTRSTWRCRPRSPARRSTWRWRSWASCTARPRPTARWDLIVVDTPPARSALDFLDAPEHLELVARRPVPAAAAGAGARPAAADECRLQPGVGGASTRSSAARSSTTCRPSFARSRRSSAASGSARRQTFELLSSRHTHVPRRRHAAARRAARGGVLRRPAHRGEHAALGHGGQPGAHERLGRSRRSGRCRLAEDLAGASSRRWRSRPATACQSDAADRNRKPPDGALRRGRPGVAQTRVQSLAD